VAGNFVRQMARAMAARGDAVRVVCVGKKDDVVVNDVGVEVVCATDVLGKTFYGNGAPDALGLGGGSVDPMAWIGAPWAVGSLAWEARNALAGCDVLVSHFVVPCGVIGGWIRGGRPHIAVVHGTDGWVLKKMPRRVQEAVLRRANLVWYSHAGLKNSVHHPEEISSWQRPMGGNDWPHQRVVHTGEALRCVVVSRLVALKGVERAVRAVGVLHQRGVPVTLCVLGDGPERAKLETLSHRVAPGVVTWMGRVDSAVRDAVLAKSNVMLHTAQMFHGRTEGAPVALVEAMEAGLAIVACDTGGVASVIETTGRLVHADANAHEIADALLEMCSERVRAKLGEAAATRAQPWRWNTTVEAMAHAARRQM
jgi:hypothetical protein